MELEIKNYKWADGARIKADPNTVGIEIDRLTNGNGNISITTYIENARQPASPLYDTITHDPQKALDEWNKMEARHILGCLRVIRLPDQPEERVLMNVSENEGVFTKVEKIKSNPELRQIALKNALRELRMFREKYAEIKELLPVITAIDELITN